MSLEKGTALCDAAENLLYSFILLATTAMTVFHPGWAFPPMRTQGKAKSADEVSEKHAAC